MATNYGFDNAKLQPLDDMSSWGMPKSTFTQDLGVDSIGQFDYSMGGGLGSVMMGDGSGGGGNGFWGSMVGHTDKNGIATQGWGGMALNAASTLGNAYLGMKQYGLAKQTLKHNKEMFAKNFDAQKRTTNASLEDRQKARIASNSGAYESVSSYMDKNGIR